MYRVAYFLQPVKQNKSKSPLAMLRMIRGLNWVSCGSAISAQQNALVFAEIYGESEGIGPYNRRVRFVRKSPLPCQMQHAVGEGAEDQAAARASSSASARLGTNSKAAPKASASGAVLWPVSVRTS